MPPPSLRLWSSLPRLRTRVSNLRSRLQRRHSAGSTKEATEAPLVGIKTDEEILGANEGEYCPINVGTVLKGGEGEIFEAVRKLGWGVNSTVWVGRNRFADSFPKYVALKVLTESATREYREPSGKKANEHDILLRTYQGKEPDHRPQKSLYVDQDLSEPTHPGWHRVSAFMGAFYSLDLRHLVLIFPLYGESMKDFMYGEPAKRLSTPYAKKVAKDTLLALDYLHSHCGIIHCDVKPENLLVDFNTGLDFDRGFEAMMKLEPNAGRDGRACPLWYPHSKFGLLRVVLTDFGHASWSEIIERSPVSIGSTALRAPELVYGFAYRTAIDIWAFGCTIFELLVGRPLFHFPDSRNPNELALEPKYHLSLMQSLAAEPFPPEFRNGTCLIEKGFLNSDGWIQNPVEGDPLEERIEKDGPNDLGDKSKFAAFLRRCLRLDYRNRASASELLKDPWLAEE